MSNIQFGDVATWVASLGTTGAFGISLLLLRQNLQDRRASQARFVAAWQDKIVPAHKPVYPKNVPYEAIIKYNLLNNSDEPVYGLSLAANCGTLGTFVRNIGVLGPHESRTISIWLPGNPRAEQYPPAITFIDATGIQWLRDFQGRLKDTNMSKAMVVIKEDPGAYGSIEAHPTLRME